ncbi:MAG: DUF1624 domain-containing protein [Acidobacteria bacterium]|nr:DUF1624 domain-containing protein [Acidobacteriota bacterium]
MSSGRVVFIDLARALAVVMMVYGHAVSALLAPDYRSGAWYDAWLFQRGLTASLFLLLAGFAFSIATTRHWPAHARLSAAVWARLRRFSLFIALGYALHFPVSRLVDLAGASDERWRSFLIVDVLQLIGVTFVLLQALVLALRSRRALVVVAFGLALVTLGVTPVTWSTEWARWLPLAAASYLTPATGSPFPLFPWAAYVLIGASAGGLYARWGAGHHLAFAHGLLLTGGALVALALSAGSLPLAIFGTGPLSWIPALVTMRIGACFLFLGVVAHASRFLARLPHGVSAVAQESLVIYFVHLCIVYGSVWNRGLRHSYGEALGPGATAAVVVVLLAAMTVLAWHWNRLKHTYPRAARWIAVAAGAVLVILLL